MIPQRACNRQRVLHFGWINPIKRENFTVQRWIKVVGRRFAIAQWRGYKMIRDVTFDLKNHKVVGQSRDCFRTRPNRFTRLVSQDQRRTVSQVHPLPPQPEILPQLGSWTESTLYSTRVAWYLSLDATAPYE